MPDKSEQNFDQIFQRIRALEEQNEALTQRLALVEETNKKQYEHMMRELVTISAQQIQMLFENPVMTSSIASNLLTSLQNALMHQASSSKNRRPVMLIVKDYVPGANRIKLSEDGVLTLESQEPGVLGVEAPWVPNPIIEAPENASVFIKLVQSYGLQADEYAYAITDIDLQEYRESLTEQITKNAENMKVQAQGSYAQ